MDKNFVFGCFSFFFFFHAKSATTNFFLRKFSFFLSFLAPFRNQKFKNLQKKRKTFEFYFYFSGHFSDKTVFQFAYFTMAVENA